MDTSKQYVKMCSCEAIQSNKPYPPSPNLHLNFYHRTIPLTDSIQKFQNASIWLPRQDQIQEMMGNHPDLILILAKSINDGIFRGQDFITFEQLWLAYYMNERHNMEWRNESWQPK